MTYARVLQKLLQEFFLSKGRGPMNAVEWSKLRKQAMELAGEGGKDPITGTTIRSAPKSLTSSKLDLPGIASLKQRSNIIPFPKQKKRGDYQKLSNKYFNPMSGAMMGKGRNIVKEGLAGLEKKMGPVDKQSWIKQKIQQNKDAIQRFKDKFIKKDKKTVEDFRDDGDFDPGGMAEGGIAPLVGEPTYAADFYDDREPFIYGGSAGLRMILKKIKKMVHGDKKGKRLFPKDLETKKLMEIGEKLDPRAVQVFKEQDTELRAEGLARIINALESDKRLMQMIEKNRSMGDSGLNFIMDKMGESMVPHIKYHKKGVKGIDQDILDLEMIRKKMLTKDRKLNAEGGRINFSGGGRAGLPAVTISTPSAMGPQMPNAAPQPQGIPGAQMQMNMMDLNQNKMMQTPYMPTGGQPYKGQFRKTFAGGGETQSSPQEIFVKVMTENYTPTPEEKEILAEYLKTENKADGGRMGFAGGGIGRRAFLKILGMLGIGAAGAKTGLIGLKSTKMAPKIAETITTTGSSTSMPPWFPSFVEKVLKKGDDITDTATTQERVIAAQTKLPNSQTDVYVEHDLVTGDTTVDIGMGKHGWGAGFHGQPARMILKKGEEITEGKNAGTRTADEFTVEEAEFTGGHPENVKFEESSYQNYGEHGSDFTELEEFATGQKAKNSKTGKQVWEADWDDSLPDDPEDFASGGIARMLGE